MNIRSPESPDIEDAEYEQLLNTAPYLNVEKDGAYRAFMMQGEYEMRFIAEMKQNGGRMESPENLLGMLRSTTLLLREYLTNFSEFVKIGTAPTLMALENIASAIQLIENEYELETPSREYSIKGQMSPFLLISLIEDSIPENPEEEIDLEKLVILKNYIIDLILFEEDRKRSLRKSAEERESEIFEENGLSSLMKAFSMRLAEVVQIHYDS